jgi:hypothetical protein
MSLLFSLRHFRAAHAANPARFRAAFLAVLAVVLVGMSLQYAAKVAKPGDDGAQTRSAFLRWRGMIRDLFAGENIYVGKNEYPNPPIMAAVLRPLAELPPMAGALTWFYAKVLMAVLAVVWAFRLVSPLADARGSAIPDVAKAIVILLSLPPLLGDLSHGNVNVFILFLVAACLETYRRGWDVASGLVLALSIACKVTPLLFVAYFAWKRAWRVLAGCAVGLALWLFVVPGSIYGWDRNTELLESWYRLMVRPAVVENRVTSEHPNQSLPGVTYRLFTHSPSFIEYDKTPEGDIPRPAGFHNLADVGTDAARWIVKGLVIGFGLLVVVLCRTPRGERQGPRFAAECGLIVLGMLLFSERSWKHHAVTLLIPFAVIASALTAAELAPRARTFLVGVLVAVGVLTVGTGLLSGRAADLAMVYGTYALAFLLLTAGVCVVLANLPRSVVVGYADTHEHNHPSP